MAMPTIPTIAEIKDRVVTDLNDKLNQTTPSLPKAFNRVLAGAFAGIIVLLYQAINWTYRQLFPDTADLAALKLLGALVNVNQQTAIAWVGTADVPGVEAYAVPTGTLFRSSSNIIYKVTTSGTVTIGVASVVLTSQTSGDAGNITDGTELSIVSPDTNLDGTAEITTTTSSGDDAEDADTYRVRVSNAYKKRRTGGAPSDYEAWGLEAPNFDWISPLDATSTVGEVQVYGKVDDQTDGIPTTSQLEELYNYLTVDPDTGLRTRHPIGPDVVTLPIERFELDIEIFIQDPTTAIESSITTSVRDYVEDQEPYNEAIATERKDTISEGGISAAANAIANPEGSTVTSVIMKETTTGNVIQSYQLFGGTWGKATTITFTEVV